jgi:transcriptional regulator with XRE-family HTH domain
MDTNILETLDPRVMGSRFQDARRAAGLTQRSVADEMAIARTTVVAIEKGERRVSAAELIKFARIYHRPVSDFVGRQTVTEGFVAQFRATERQILETNSEYEAAALDLQTRSEDYVELEQNSRSAKSTSVSSDLRDDWWKPRPGW